MLFDFAQTSKLSTRKSERLYASHDLRKLCCLFRKGAFRSPKGRCACPSFGFCHSERSRVARKEVHHFRSSAREREGLRPDHP
jgi:hypothetical protein